MTDPKQVYTRDLSSGRVHRRVLVEGMYMSLEADNLDDAGEFEVIESIDAAEPGDLCERCFGKRTPEEEA